MKTEEKKRRERVQIRLKKKLKELAEDKATTNGRSLSNYIERLIEKDVNN